MTDQEKEIAEAYIEDISKTALISIYDIYDKYNGTSNTGCWCGASFRNSKHKAFYEWYNANKDIE